MSVLPNQILPQTIPFGKVQPDGRVLIEHDWWLLIYNICLNSIGSQIGLPASALTELASTDSDAADSDATVLRQPIENLESRVYDDPVRSESEFPDIARALLQSQDAILPDPVPQAQPISAISPTGSPFTYTLPFAGTVSVTSGTVSQITVLRTGVSVVTGLTSGLFQLSRFDQLKVTYSGTPTMNFIPWSSQ